VSVLADPRLALAVPAAGAVLIALTGRWPNLRESLTLVTSVALFAVAASLVPGILAGERPESILLTMLPGLALELRVEPLGMLFALVASALWILNSIYSIGYMRANQEQHQTRFYVCFAIALASTMGVAFAGNLLTLFLFYEALTLSTYPLVTHHGTPEVQRAGRIYLGILLGTSIGLLLLAIVWTWSLAGTIAFEPGGVLAGVAPNATIAILLALYMFGIGKAALMPFHRWLPAAMVAPTPVSALLHAVAVVKAGVFSVLKVIVYIFGVDALADTGGIGWLPIAAGITIIVASIIALRSDNLKRRLAYSTVSQLSYVVLAAALLTPMAVIGAALHIASHAVSKITLFFAAGAIYTAAHKTEVSQLDGIGRRMPLTMGAFTVGSLSLIGIPPAAGFLSKWYIISAAAEGGQLLAIAVIVVSTLLNAAYFLPIVHAAFFRPPPAAEPAHGEAPAAILAAMVGSAALTLTLLFFADVPLRLAAELAAGK
jgi:multicomponent Na+:H+ antiporter subunit D